MSRSRPFKIEPLTPTLGAEVTQVDLRDRRPAAIAAIKKALVEHQVLFFRDQDLAPEEFLALGKAMGTISFHPSYKKRHPTVPELTVVEATPTSTVVFGEGWHADQTCQIAPPSVALLHVTELPPAGGDTIWSSATAAYEALSEPMKHFARGLTAYHNGVKPTRGYVMAPVNEMLHNEHPVVIAHPVTKRPVLFVNRIMVTHIPQLTWNESERVLALLYEHVAEPRFHVRFRWSRNTVAIWDNLSTQHTVVWDYHGHSRRAFRLTLEGTKPVAADPKRVRFQDEQMVRYEDETHPDFKGKKRTKTSGKGRR